MGYILHMSVLASEQCPALGWSAIIYSIGCSLNHSLIMSLTDTSSNKKKFLLTKQQRGRGNQLSGLKLPHFQTYHEKKEDRQVPIMHSFLLGVQTMCKAACR